MNKGLKTELTSNCDNYLLASALDTLEYPRHRWYFVKEAFSPDLVMQALKESDCTPGNLIIDVFCGGGTVPLTAASNGFDAIGFEVNPFLAFVAKSKLLQCRINSLEKYVTLLINGAQIGANSNLKGFSTFTKIEGSNKWLFNDEVLNAFEGSWQASLGMPMPFRDLLRLSSIAAALDVCNAVKDGKCLRYRNDWGDHNFKREDFIKALNKRIQMIREDITSNPLKGKKAKVLVADSRALDAVYPDKRKFKLCISSPPYLNSFDYSDIYRPELFLGKFMRTNRGLRGLRLKTVRSHMQVDWSFTEDKELSNVLDQSFSKIKENEEHLWNKRIPEMIQAYFEDMKVVLTKLKRFASEEASVWFVVSTSAYAGFEIPVDLILADIGSKAGWSLREVKAISCLRRVPGQQYDRLSENGNKSPNLRESIVIFENKPRLKYYIFRA